MNQNKKIINPPETCTKTVGNVSTGNIIDKGVSYKGQLTVELRNKQNKIIQTKKYTNNGCVDLFNFICRCLAQNYNGLKAPGRLVLFAFPESLPEYLTTWPNPQAIFWNTTEQESSSGSIQIKCQNQGSLENLSLKIVAPPISTAGDAATEIQRATTLADGGDSASVSYTFRIPGNIIPSSTQVIAMGLYSSEVTNINKISNSNTLAYYLLTNNDTDTNATGETESETWEPLDIPENSQEYSVHITWQLIFAN